MPARLAFKLKVALFGFALTTAILIAALWPVFPSIIRAAGDFHLRAPDWALWAEVSLVVKAHVYAALAALLIGTTILLRPKGRALHKVLGWSWVVVMTITAISSLFIMDLNGGFFSFLHLFSGWVLIALPFAIAAIRNRRVDAHRRAMTSTFVGGLLIAGALSFIPGRVMFEMFFG